MRRIYRALVFVVLLLGFVMLCLVGVLENGRRINTKRILDDDEKSTSTSLKHMEVIGRDSNKGNLHPKLDLHFMSKRRVPNGPDPIHNRRAGNSRRPPGKA